jgi:hypothetical protein
MQVEKDFTPVVGYDMHHVGHNVIIGYWLNGQPKHVKADAIHNHDAFHSWELNSLIAEGGHEELVAEIKKRQAQKIRNFTPHSFDVYAQAQFVGFEQVNPTTFIADSVGGDPILSLPSEGSVRIATSTESLGIVNGVPAFKTVYGEASGFPTDLNDGDVVIVSLPVVSSLNASGSPLAKYAASPYKAVRLRSNTSQVLGALGYTH